MLEDDGDDRYLAESTLNETGIDISIKFFSTGTELLQALDSSKLPAFILLDYNSHPENGLQVLQRIKAQPSLAHIPIIILSDSAEESLVKECYQQGASSFVRKPTTLNITKHKIKTFFTYWMEVVEV